MKLFTQLIEILDNTTKTNAKISALENFFLNCDEEDKIWALALLTGRRPKRTVNTTFLRIWAAEKAHIPLWLFEECYHVAGDLAETIALLISSKNDDLAVSEPLHHWMKGLKALENKEDDTKKQYIFEAWRRFGYYDCFIFNKIITGGFRIGVSEKLVVKALAKTEKLDENMVSHCISGNWTPDTTTFSSLLNPENFKADLSKPYPFFLAYPLENELDTLGNPDDWSAEWKWDGLRGQVINRKGEIYIWSRGEEIITEKFPELKQMAKRLPLDTVLDGEVICWKENKPMSFQHLQTRIGRKTVGSKLLKDCPTVLIAYDVLEYNGVDIRDKTFEERRNILKTIVAVTDSAQLILSPQLDFSNWAELADLRQNAAKYLAEGLMLKHKQSVYETGRRRGDWWKWKIDPYTIDAVLIYAQKGHGRRADLYTDYTFALWNENQELVPFAKAYSGLTDKELVEIDRFVKKNTKEKFGPVRSVVPELVFELAFEGINISNRHKSGVAVRFPRILRWRKDKKINDANTLADLKKLITN